MKTIANEIYLDKTFSPVQDCDTFSARSKGRGSSSGGRMWRGGSKTWFFCGRHKCTHSVDLSLTHFLGWCDGCRTIPLDNSPGQLPPRQFPLPFWVGHFPLDTIPPQYVMHTYIHMYAHTHTYIHKHIHIHTYIHTYIYIHTYTYIHIRAYISGLLIAVAPR